MPALERLNQPRLLITRRNPPPVTRLTRQTSRALVALEQRSVVRLANVQAEGVVQAEKLREISNLAREGLTNQSLLYRWANTLAAGDPILRDDLRFFEEVAKVGQGEVIADTVDSYCRESRS